MPKTNITFSQAVRPLVAYIGQFDWTRLRRLLFVGFTLSMLAGSVYAAMASVFSPQFLSQTTNSPLILFLRLLALLSPTLCGYLFGTALALYAAIQAGRLPSMRSEAAMHDKRSMKAGLTVSFICSTVSILVAVSAPPEVQTPALALLVACICGIARKWMKDVYTA